MSEATVEVLEAEEHVEDTARSLMVAVTWTFATFALGLALVTVIWMMNEHLPDNFWWDLITG